MKKYRYKWIYIESGGDIDKTLDFWGQYGWKLVTVDGPNFYLALEYE